MESVWNPTIDIPIYIYTLRSAQDGAGTRRYATELVSPFSTLFHPVSSRYPDTTGFFSLASYEARNIFAPRFDEIKCNSIVSIHRYAEMNRHSFLSCDSIHFYPIISYFCSLLLFNIVPFVAYVRLRISRGDGRTRKKRKTRSIPRTERNSLRGISLSGTRQNS